MPRGPTVPGVTCWFLFLRAPLFTLSASDSVLLARTGIPIGESTNEKNTEQYMHIANNATNDTDASTVLFDHNGKYSGKVN